jgi:hypothetical protein
MQVAKHFVTGRCAPAIGRTPGDVMLPASQFSFSEVSMTTHRRTALLAALGAVLSLPAGLAMAQDGPPPAPRGDAPAARHRPPGGQHGPRHAPPHHHHARHQPRHHHDQPGPRRHGDQPPPPPRNG